MKINFSKMHALGNDFIVINNLLGNIKLTTEQAKLIAHRHLGIGCDQILLIEKNNHLSDDQFIYRIYNNDGSPAHNCGNGARCIAKYILDNNLSTQAQIKLLLVDRYITAKKLPNNLFEIEMGTPKFYQQEITLSQLIDDNYYESPTLKNTINNMSIVSMGNLHLVLWLNNSPNQFNTRELECLAQKLQNNHQVFPNSVNVNFAYLTANEEVDLITYERGAGFTASCGSGACATGASAIKLKLTDNSVVIISRYGQSTITWIKEHDPIYLIGPATHIFDGTIDLCAN